MTPCCDTRVGTLQVPRTHTQSISRQHSCEVRSEFGLCTSQFFVMWTKIHKYFARLGMIYLFSGKSWSFTFRAENTYNNRDVFRISTSVSLPHLVIQKPAKPLHDLSLLSMLSGFSSRIFAPPVKLGEAICTATVKKPRVNVW